MFFANADPPSCGSVTLNYFGPSFNQPRSIGNLNFRIGDWMRNPKKVLDLSSLDLVKWPKFLYGKEELIEKIDLSYNERLKTIPFLVNLKNLRWSSALGVLGNSGGGVLLPNLKPLSKIYLTTRPHIRMPDHADIKKIKTNQDFHHYWRLNWELVSKMDSYYRKQAQLDIRVGERVFKWLRNTSKVLDISFLNLTEWPEILKGKEDLIVKLNCSSNQLTSLPSPSDLPNLTKLYCNNNKLTSLPRLLKLTHLDCSDNRLTSLPPHLPKLTNLECENNQLTSLPLCLPNLTKLECNKNQLTSLSLCLTNLTYLRCSHNQLTSLPLRLPNLTHLDCSYNQLTSLPLFSKLTELLCFNTQSARTGTQSARTGTQSARSGNHLTSLPRLPNLTTLWCWNNALFSNKLTKWKRVWRLKALRSNEIRIRGLKRVVKVLRNRLYLPRLDALMKELIYSPNHPGKFYKDLRIGNWSFEIKTKKLTK